MNYNELVESLADYLTGKGLKDPTLVYHGTTHPHEIMPLNIGKTHEWGMFGRGIYTTTNPEVASGFTRKPTKGSSSNQERPRIYPFVLNTKNPLDADNYELDNDQLSTLGLKGRGLYHAPRTLQRLRVQDSHLIPNFHKNIPKLGFDSITHKGGTIFGDIPHQVHIVHNPETGLIPLFKGNKYGL